MDAGHLLDSLFHQRPLLLLRRNDFLDVGSFGVQDAGVIDVVECLE